MNKPEEGAVQALVKDLECMLQQWRRGAPGVGETDSARVSTLSCAEVLERRLKNFKYDMRQCAGQLPEKASFRNRQVGGDHYRKGGGIQPVDYARSHSMQFNEACIVKYATRWQDKDGLKDLQKITHYVEIIIEQEGLTKEMPFGPNGKAAE